MRSDLVFGAHAQVPNRYLLCRLAAHATCKLHRPNDRIPDTVDDVLILFGEVNPMAEAVVSPKPTAAPAARRVRALHSVSPLIAHLDLMCVAKSHAGLSSLERIGA